MGKYKTPSGWKRIKLGEYLTELSQRNSTSVDNGTPVLSVTNRPGFSISEEHFYKKVFSKDLSNYKMIRRGQFAYNPSRVNVGSIARLKEFDKGLLSPMYVTFEAKKGLSGAYLDHWILSPRFRSLVKAGTQGSVRNSLNFSALADFPLDLPPDEEQERIVAILDHVDLVINQTHAVIDQIQILKRGLIRELFTRGIPSRHKKFKKTEVGEMPDNWEVKTVKELVSICQYGLNKPLSSDMSGIPVLRMNNLEAGKIDAGDIKYAILTKEEEREYLLEPGDVLFNRTNSRALVGKVAIFKERRKMSFASYLLRLKAKRGETDPRWLNYYFNITDTQNKLSHMATPGVSQSNINAQAMQSLRFKTPPIEEQKIIADSIDLIETRITQEALVMDGYVELKHAIMQALLTGEVRVKL